MTKQEVLKLCGKGEQTPVQLKERVLDTYEVGKEIVFGAKVTKKVSG